MLVGREPDSLGIARGVFTAIGFGALSDIKDDFVRKAKGGTGEDGNTWPPLSPKTIAYHRRFGPGEKAALKKAAGLGKGNRHGPGGQPGLLTAQQRKRWNAIFASRLSRLLLSMPAPAAKARAAAIAWATLKREGAKTMLEVYGNRKVEILRDTGVLLNSLSPGEITGDGSGIQYKPPSDNGGDRQVFSLFDSGVIVGTTVAYAATHQEGDPARNIPARPFLPTRGVPSIWLERWRDLGQAALAAGARQLYGVAP
jgi:hypothetical protein